MRRNNIWMRYLTLGLIISIGILLNSCKDYFFNMVVEYHFVNETNYSISYPVGYEKFNVAPKSTIVIIEQGKGGGKHGVAASDFSSPLSSISALGIFTIKFNQAKCLVDIKPDDEHSVRNIKNFVAEKIAENSYKFTYTFTEADYNRAVQCP